MMRPVRGAILALCWVVVVLAPFVSHAAILGGRFGGLAAAFAAVQIVTLASVTLSGWQGRRRAAGALVALTLLLLLAARLVWPAWIGPAGLLASSGASHALIYGSLLLLFGQSLQPGRTDLITGLAQRLRGHLTPGMLTYTRIVTKAWCCFFVLQLITSALLLAFAPAPVWSLFVNVLDGPSVIVMFAGEYAVRRWRFRHYQHISPLETFRSFARAARVVEPSRVPEPNRLVRVWRPTATIRTSVALHGTAAGLLALQPGWWPVLAGAVAANHAALAGLGLWPRSQALGPTLFRLPGPGDAIAVTIDDGPDPAVTPRVLDQLAAAGAIASFFCIGERARRHPALVRRIVAGGHRVENHSLSHPLHFAFLVGRALRRQVQDAQDILADVTGTPPTWFRAPMGFRGPPLDHALAQAGLHLMAWSRRGYDTTCADPARVSTRLQRGLRAGDIVLMHDGNSARMACGTPVIHASLPGFLRAVSAAGLAVRPVPAATAAPAAEPGTQPSAAHAST